MEKSFDITFGGGKKIEIQIHGHSIKTDQPVSAGGESSAPSPFDLFLASIGTCAGFYVASFCQARDIPTDQIKLTQTVARNDVSHMVERVSLAIGLPPDFPEQYRMAVIKAAESCPVKKHLASPPLIEVTTIQQ